MSAYTHEELEPEFELPADEFEAGAEGQAEDSFEGESGFDETEEMQLASELLEVTDEAELDQFLGNLLRKAGRAFGRGLNSPLGRTLGGFLKGAIKKAWPSLGGALGNMIVPGLGGAIGSRLAASAGGMFGLELEGLSSEDQEFEVARRLVRFAGTAARNAARLGSRNGAFGSAGNLARIAQQSLQGAARHHAPGLLRAGGNPLRGSGPVAHATCHCGSHGSPSSGRWVRRGGKIYLLGT